MKQFFFYYLLLLSASIFSQTCGVSNAILQITDCTNCIIQDDTATGNLGEDSSLIVESTNCECIELTLNYNYEWEQGESFSWIHGFIANTSENISNLSLEAGIGFIYMDSGITGCCSGLNFGPGAYFDGSSVSSAPDAFELNFAGPNMCTATFLNNSGCEAVCNSDESLIENSTSPNPICEGLIFADYFNINPGGGYPISSGANDGVPNNNWGLDCTTNCPQVQLNLTYCPDNSGENVENLDITITTDGESGCFCNYEECNSANSFEISFIVNDVFGCTDPQSGNYNPLATCDDGTCNTLAVQIITFQGEATDLGNLIEWELTTDGLTKTIYLEKRMEAESQFTVVSEFSLDNIKNRKLKYDFLDRQVSNNLAYYRLSEVTLSGQKKIVSRIIALQSINEKTFNINPNPASDFLHIEFPSYKSDGYWSYELHNTNGKVILNKLDIKTPTERIDLRNFKAGVYLINVNSNNYKYSKIFIKK